MKKPFGNSKKRPFSPSGRPPGGPRKFGGPRSDDDRGPRTSGGGSGYGQSDRKSDDRPSRPAWKRDDRDNRGGYQGKSPGGKPPWKKDRPDSHGDRPSYRSSDDRPRYDRPGFNKSGSDRPRSDRPSYDKPGFDKPRYGKPGGDESSSYDRRRNDTSGYEKPSYDKGPRPGFKPGFKPGFGGGRPKPGYSSGPGKPAFSAGAGRPAWKREDHEGLASSDRPAWKKDRPSYNPGPGSKPRNSYQPREDRPYKPRPYNDRPDSPRPYGGGYGDRPQQRRESSSWQRPQGEDRPQKRWEDRREDRFEKKDRYPRQEAETPRENQESQDRFEGAGGRVSVPSNKANRPADDYYAAPQQKLPPFKSRHYEGSPSAKALVVTLSDTNNVPTRIVWVYDTMVGELPDGEPAPGATVFVHDEKHRFIGSAIYNPHSRIRARIFSLTRQKFDEEYIRENLKKAVARRKTLGLLGETCRVVFGDGDGIPGLIADKIGSCLVIQPLTFAVNMHLPFIIDRLNELVAPDGIVVRRDVPIRAKEGLPVEEAEIHGTVPERIAVKEEGVTLFANITVGQKTGLFLDQRFNRSVIEPYCTPGASVLDLFCHVGGWALRAARYGATEVIGVDSSRSSLDLAEAGAQASGLQDKVSFVEDDVFEYLRALEPDKLFDVIVVDPPAFAKTRQHYEEAFRAYLSLNYLAMKKLKPGGVLVTCSCSQALSTTEFNEAILTSARNARMQFQVTERRGAPADHPVLLGLPETEYLKCFVLLRTE